MDLPIVFIDDDSAPTSPRMSVTEGANGDVLCNRPASACDGFALCRDLVEIVSEKQKELGQSGSISQAVIKSFVNKAGFGGLSAMLVACSL